MNRSDRRKAAREALATLRQALSDPEYGYGRMTPEVERLADDAYLYFHAGDFTTSALRATQAVNALGGGR